MLTIPSEKYTANLINFVERCQRHYGTRSKPMRLGALGRLANKPYLPQIVNNWKVNGCKRIISDYSFLAAIDPKKRPAHILKAHLEENIPSSLFTHTEPSATIDDESIAGLVPA